MDGIKLGKLDKKRLLKRIADLEFSLADLKARINKKKEEELTREDLFEMINDVPKLDRLPEMDIDEKDREPLIEAIRMM